MSLTYNNAYYYGGGYKRNTRNFTTHVANPSNVIPLDEQLVVDLLTIVSPSYKEDPMRNFIRDFIKNNVPTALVESDQNGNLYITKTKKKDTPEFYPCIVSHMDEVVSDVDDRQIVKVGNLLMGISRITGEKSGTGGDDKCGIYVCLEMLRLMDHVKVAFFIAEEVGGVGSNCCDMTFFKDCRYVLQPDRYGNQSVITRTNGMYVTTQEFEDSIDDIMTTFNYLYDDGGTFTDIGVLAKRGLELAVSNISCGYYDQHTEEEVVCIPDLENCLNFIYSIFLTLEDKQFYREFIPIKTTNYGSGSYGGQGYVQDDFDDWDDYRANWRNSALSNSQSSQFSGFDNIEETIKAAYEQEKQALSQEEKEFDIQYLNMSTVNDLTTLDDDSLTYFLKYYPNEVKKKIGTLVFNTLERRLMAY